MNGEDRRGFLEKVTFEQMLVRRKSQLVKVCEEEGRVGTEAQRQGSLAYLRERKVNGTGVECGKMVQGKVGRRGGG